MRAKQLLLTSAAIVAPGLLVAVPASAQSVTLDPPQIRLPLDGNGVDMSDGSIVVPSSSLGIGGSEGLSHTRTRTGDSWRHNFLISAAITQGQSQASVNMGGSLMTFTLVSGVYQSNQGTGETITTNFSTGTHTLTLRDGTQVIFKESYAANGESYYGPVDALAETIIAPNGQRTTLHYKNSTYQEEVLTGYFLTRYVVRLQSVTNNAGYQLKYGYASDSLNENTVDDWYEMSKVTAINNATEYCNPVADNCSVASTWPHLTYAFSTSGSDTLETVTDVLGRQTRFRTDASDRLTGVKRPSETSDGMVIAYNTDDRVTSITYQGTQSTTYSWLEANGNLLSVINGGLGRQSNVTADPVEGVVKRVSNALLETTDFEYDSNGRLTKVIAPEDNEVQYTYDARGNTTQVRRKAKPGSGAADIITSATYAASCTNAVTCNLPTSTTDARGKTTNYTYNSTHGGATLVQAPADSSGQRPTTSFTYANRYARKKNSSGTLVQESTAITKLIKSETCRTSATCNGSANSRVTEIAYNNTLSENLHPTSVTVKQGNGSYAQTTAYTYTDLGLVETVDGPLSGTSDTSTFRYDSAGQLEGTISADPDGTGSLPRLASRRTYNLDGQVTVSETGTVTGTTQTAWNNFAVDTKFVTAYDDFGRVETSAQVAPTGTTQYSLTQYSYDAAGRPDCVAVRMNAPTTTTSLPASACTKMTAGSYGDDRIVKRYYDTADRVTEVWSGFGTSLAQQTAQMSYNDNGTVAWVEDAKNNRTNYTYDGHDRSYRITYPDASYEQVSYDAGGNILTHRTRRNETITYNYDNLSRVTSKIVPNRSGLSTTHTRNVYYGYDLYGAMTYARFDSTGGQGVIFNYDGLGRLYSTVQTLDGMNRTVSYGYNSQGRLANITHADNVRFNYNYDTLNRPINIQRHGAETIQSFLYDNQGRQWWRGQGGGAFRQWRNFDGAGRTLQSRITKWGTPEDNITDYAYNPANQVISEDISNQSFVWNKHPTTDVNHTFGANNLNQISQLNSTNFGYDTNGNLTSDGSTSYVYDVENRLVSVAGGNAATLRYDPLGRLYEVTDGVGNKRRMLYDGDALVAEYNASGTMLNRYVHGLGAGDDPLVRYSGSSVAWSNARILYKDYRGSVVFEADKDGNNRVHTPYDEYGVHGTNSPQRFGYTGQAYVPEIGLYYYKARMYSPGLGRFMQTDPIGYADGMNLYRYVGNDPVNFVDPTGLRIVVIGHKKKCKSCIRRSDLMELLNAYKGGIDWFQNQEQFKNIEFFTIHEHDSDEDDEPQSVNVDSSCKGLPAAYDPRVQQSAVDALHASLSGNPQGTAEHGFWVAEPIFGEERWIGPTFTDGYRTGFNPQRLTRRRPGGIQNVLTGYYPTSILVHTHPNNPPPSPITPGVDDNYGNPVIAIDKGYNITCGGV